MEYNFLGSMVHKQDLATTEDHSVDLFPGTAPSQINLQFERNHRPYPTAIPICTQKCMAV